MTNFPVTLAGINGSTIGYFFNDELFEIKVGTNFLIDRFLGILRPIQNPQAGSWRALADGSLRRNI